MIQAWLAARSADVSYGLLLLLGLPVVRDGVFITVPGLTIEVAPECSGLRSAVVLIGVGALVGHWALRAWWTRAIMLALLVPLAIVKNGVRIATLTLLAAYVDPAWLTGKLHLQGGIVFFALTLCLLGSFVIVLRRVERPCATSS